MYKIAAAFIIATSMISCSGGWSEEDKESYKKSCLLDAKQITTDANAEKYCDCYMEKLTKRYPAFNDFLEHPNADSMIRDVQLCKEEAGIAGPNSFRGIVFSLIE